MTSSFILCNKLAVSWKCEEVRSHSFHFVLFLVWELICNPNAKHGHATVRISVVFLTLSKNIQLVCRFAKFYFWNCSDPARLVDGELLKGTLVQVHCTSVHLYRTAHEISCGNNWWKKLKLVREKSLWKMHLWELTFIQPICRRAVNKAWETRDNQDLVSRSASLQTFGSHQGGEWQNFFCFSPHFPHIEEASNSLHWLPLESF